MKSMRSRVDTLTWRAWTRTSKDQFTEPAGVSKWQCTLLNKNQFHRPKQSSLVQIMLWQRLIQKSFRVKGRKFHFSKFQNLAPIGPSKTSEYFCTIHNRHTFFFFFSGLRNDSTSCRRASGSKDSNNSCDCVAKSNSASISKGEQKR